MTRPFTLNIIYANGKIVTRTYHGMLTAISAARKAAKRDNTAHATVTHEPTGGEIYNAPGDFYIEERWTRAFGPGQ
jgi:hypothetical protein